MENLEKLIIDLKDSLERELAGLRHDLQHGLAELNGRFDTQAARLERLAEIDDVVFIAEIRKGD